MKSSRNNQSNAAGSGLNQLSEGTEIKGDLRSKSDIRIDGKFEGDLICENKVVVGANGVVVGNIHCKNADIQGRVNGEVHAQAVIVLRASAQLLGNMKTDKLVIENGAKFSGNCSMDNQEAGQNASVSQGAAV